MLKDIYHNVIKFILSISYKITNRLELEDLKLEGNLAPDSYSFYKEAFELFQTERASARIDQVINNSESLKKKQDKFKEYQLQYSYYPDINKNKH